ncbi:MAG: cation transporter dimerization domain-containing protein [Sulfolobales archaeon]|nr:cation transporter [Sulfolobales archaeon]MDW8083524.1 cation transporter dimerization domain-containing protein [Sulfolobales archaeon]
MENPHDFHVDVGIGKRATNEDSRNSRYFYLVVLLSAAGGFFKIVSGLVYGSKAALVDALTSIVNVAAALLVAKYEVLSLKPPDRDHHYGHKRFYVGGSMFSTVLYSVVGGALLIDLLYSSMVSYEVHILAVFFATLGAIPYLTAIAISRKVGGSYETYARYTVIEVVECAVVILASLGGALVSYLIDLSGAVFLLVYLFTEIVREVRELLSLISDKAPSFIVDRVREISRELGVEIRSIRVREVVPGRYHGDAVVVLPAETTLEKAHEVAHRVEQALKKQGVEADLVIHIEPFHQK